VFQHSLYALGKALAPWLDRFRATILVVGGSIARSWDLVEGPLRRGLDESRPRLSSRVQVSPAVRPHEAALIGAAMFVRAGSSTGR
jgi:glucokinase